MFNAYSLYIKKFLVAVLLSAQASQPPLHQPGSAFDVPEVLADTVLYKSERHSPCLVAPSPLQRTYASEELPRRATKAQHAAEPTADPTPVPTAGVTCSLLLLLLVCSLLVGRLVTGEISFQQCAALLLQKSTWDSVQCSETNFLARIYDRTRNQTEVERQGKEESDASSALASAIT